MQLRYDEDLIEAAAFLCASGRRRGVPALQIARFNREREKLYAILDPDERNAAFFKLHLDWFREWQLEKLLTDLLNEFPVVRTSVKLLAFRKARGRNEEGAELYVSAENGRSAVVALRPERFARDEELLPFLRHEFMHLHDMVDAAFGYSPELHLSGQNAAQQRATRERYRLLWDIAIDGRLTHAKRATTGNCEVHRAAFDRAFGFWPESKRDEVFSNLWSGQNPRHGEMLAIAADPREVRTVHQPLPGAMCPLCDSPTFDWIIGASVDRGVQAAVESEFPAWSPAQGMCGRCHKVYTAAVHRARALVPLEAAVTVADFGVR